MYENYATIRDSKGLRDSDVAKATGISRCNWCGNCIISAFRNNYNPAIHKRERFQTGRRDDTI